MTNKLSHVSNKIARRVQKQAERWAAAYWHNNPFCTVPKADEATYLGLWHKARGEKFPEIDALEREMGYAVDTEWLHELALHTQVVIKTSPICYQHGRVLYSVLSKYLADSNIDSVNIVETGTARGFSSTVMAKALSDSQNHGRIMTVDLLPHDRRMYWNCIDDLKGMVTRRALLAPWKNLIERHVMFLEGDSRVMMSRFKMERIHFAFLDGAHTRKDVLAEISFVAPYQQAGDITVFDDYSPTIFPGLVEAVDEGCHHYNYSMNVIRSDGDRAYVIARKRG